MSAIKNMLIPFFIILSGAFISLTLFCTIFPPSYLSVTLFWQIIVASACCTASLLVFHTRKELSKDQMKRRFIMHFFIINVILLVFSYFGDWINFSKPMEVIVFIGLVSGIYFVIQFMLNRIDAIEARRMKLRLEEIQKKDKK